MASINYTSAINTSFNNSASDASWNTPNDFQFSSDVFIDFESQIFFENDENSCNAANLSQASKKICKPASISEVQEASKPSYQRRARKGRNPWSSKEDALLVELMKKYGQSWAMISSALPGRTGKQVRDRFLNKLRPNIRCGDWSAEEDECIVTLSKEIGNRWSLIATHLPGRTEAQVKNRYYSHIKKRLDSNGALSQTTASRTISEGFSSAITSPQAEDLSFDFRQGYDFSMFNGSQSQSQAVNMNQVPSCGSETFSNESTVQSPSAQTVYSSPYGTRPSEPVDFTLSNVSKDLFCNQPSSPIFATIENDSQIDDMLNQVTNHFSGNKSSVDVDSYFSDDLNRSETAESLIFSSQENESVERFEQLSKRKAYLELALAKTLKEMKGL